MKLRIPVHIRYTFISLLLILLFFGVKRYIYKLEWILKYPNMGITLFMYSDNLFALKFTRNLLSRFLCYDETFMRVQK